MPVVRRNPTAQLLRHNNRCYLIDCGEGTQLTLRKQHVKIQNIQAVFISHLHGDHYLGLMGFISSLNLLGRSKPLTIVAPPALKQILALQMEASGSKLSFALTFVDTNDDDIHKVYEDKSVTVYSFPLIHRVQTTGYKFVEKPRQANIIKSKISFYNIPVNKIKEIKDGADFVESSGRIIPNAELVVPPSDPKSYAFCSDTKFDEKIVPHIVNVDVLYHESTFLDEHKARAARTFHSTAKDAATIAKLADVKKLILGHYSARYIDLEPFITEAKPIFNNVHLAEDHMTFEI